MPRDDGNDVRTQNVSKVWDERQTLEAISRSEGSFRFFKRFQTVEEREGLGDGMEVGLEMQRPPTSTI